MLALTAALIAAPAVADEPTTVTGERHRVYQERVSYADLDLRTAEARRSLFRRIRQASARVCDLSEGTMRYEPSLAWRYGCVGQTYYQARPQAMAAIDRAKSGHAQQTMALVITRPASAR